METTKDYFKGKIRITKGTYRTTRISLSSGDAEDYPGCRLNVGYGKYNIRISLPSIIKPDREKVIAHGWDADTIKRLGRNYYYNYIEKVYGFYLSGNCLCVMYGQQPEDSDKGNKRVSWFLPWNEYRLVRHTMYNADGTELCTRDCKIDFDKHSESIKNKYKAMQNINNTLYKMRFKFKDYDGVEVIANTYIEEYEWHRGIGLFSWLSLFCKPKIRRSLNVWYSEEVGKGKESWKGGNRGHGITMPAGKTHEEVFRKYCLENNLQFMHVLY